MTIEQNAFVTARVGDLAPSPTLAVAKQARALRKQGVDVVDFGPGEPDFPTPPHVLAAAVASLEAGDTHYAPSRGVPALLEAIALSLERDYHLRYDPATEIVVTPGAKQAIVEAVLTTVGPGDEVLLLDPTWGSYDAIVRLAAGVPVHVPARPDFSLDVERLRAALTSRSRVLIVGSPGNPTGYVLRRDEWDEIAAICHERDLLLISDEIYARIVYDGARPISPASLPGMWERTVTVNGFSKAYAMTGWRLGYAAAPGPLLSQMLKVHEHTVTSATTFAQVGAIAALTGLQEPIDAMVAEFARRRATIVAGLNRLPGVRCLPPDGAFYAFPDISATGRTGTELAEHLLGYGVALTPGVGFGEGWDTHVRLSFATSDERIQTGLQRMAEALSQ